MNSQSSYLSFVGSVNNLVLERVKYMSSMDSWTYTIRFSIFVCVLLAVIPSLSRGTWKLGSG